MNRTGPRGSTGWQRHRIELEIPAETTNINFGLLLPGKGTAWFDDLRIELDGEPYRAPEQFGLDFEEEQPLGFFSPPGTYRVRTTADDATSGAQCLEIAWVGEEAPSAEDAVDGCREVLAHLEARRDAYAKELPAGEVDWPLQNARVVLQCLQQRAGDRIQTRDRSMADNVAWLAGQRPDERLVLWAHNGHVARKLGWMGRYLDERFGDEQLVVGFATSVGEYYAMGAGGSEERVHVLAAPPEDSFEALLGELDEPLLVVDLRDAEPDSEGSGWLHEPLLFRSIGAMEMDQQFFPARLAEEYDLIVYLRHTTAARQLPWNRAR
jgi:erythromycin esterase